MMGWMFEAWASFRAKVPRAEEAPLIISGSGGAIEGRGDQGTGKEWIL